MYTQFKNTLTHTFTSSVCMHSACLGHTVYTMNRWARNYVLCCLGKYVRVCIAQKRQPGASSERARAKKINDKMKFKRLKADDHLFRCGERFVKQFSERKRALSFSFATRCSRLMLCASHSHNRRFYCSDVVTHCGFI